MGFDQRDFERAFEAFVQTYNVEPRSVECSPDVLDRYCRLFESDPNAARRREVRYRGLRMRAAVLAPLTVCFEGEVDEGRMGDW